MKTSLLFSEKQIEARVQALADQINRKYPGEEVLAVGILKGAFVFFSDLIRRLKTDTVCDFCAVSFYGGARKAESEGRLTLDISETLKNKHVLLVDGIADCGYSLSYIQDHVRRRGPKSLTSVVLVSKPAAKEKALIDFSGFQVDQDVFVVGYGMDYKEEGRDLPYLAQLEDLN